MLLEKYTRASLNKTKPKTYHNLEINSSLGRPKPSVLGRGCCVLSKEISKSSTQPFLDFHYNKENEAIDRLYLGKRRGKCDRSVEHSVTT